MIQLVEAESKAEESTVEVEINKNDVPTEPETTPLVSTLEIEENEGDEEEDEETSQNQRGLPRRNARRARGRRAGATGRTRVVSTKIYAPRRKLTNVSSTAAINNDETLNTTLEETIQIETEEETPTKTSATVENEAETKISDTQPIEETSTPNIRVSARIKARASSGRNRQFPYADDYVDLDDLEKQTKATAASLTRKSSRGAAAATGRTSSTSQKRISVRQQATETNGNLDETTKKPKDQIDVDEDMETGGENEEPVINETTRTSTVGRKRKSATPVASTTTTTTNKRR